MGGGICTHVRSGGRRVSGMKVEGSGPRWSHPPPVQCSTLRLSRCRARSEDFTLLVSFDPLIPRFCDGTGTEFLVLTMTTLGTTVPESRIEASALAESCHQSPHKGFPFGLFRGGVL